MAIKKWLQTTAVLGTALASTTVLAQGEIKVGHLTYHT